MNLNEIFEFTLTEAGASVMNKTRGYAKWESGELYRDQLWVLMSELGPHMHMAAPTLIVGNKIITASDLELREYA